ncbi:hypothetical protein M0813_07559 [Anaeramoeba flamelloides]|uniref:Uncharacterized protein n=1 Tax=Anaeramoeba flamelloides TaxID=1746091 RepID=A0ABQ8XA86_9EUKA|nr:hypothetical protein M0813_07559 [Anaeramoeba flamelloides]
MSEDQKGLTNIGNSKYIQNKSESNLPTSATSETIETRISENELNHNELYSEAKSQSAFKSSLREKEDILKTKINKVQSNLVYKCLCFSKYKHKKKTFYVLFHFLIEKQLKKYHQIYLTFPLEKNSMMFGETAQDHRDHVIRKHFMR